MPLPPQKFREIVFQLLYSQDFAQLDQDEYIPFIMKLLEVTRKSVTEAFQKILYITTLYPEIDERIRESSTDYSFERISRVERTVLRLGIFELLFEEALPPKVAIAEAIRLCRKFGTPESAHFVNAVLDDVYQKKMQPV
jgi:N utilization substance protein B